MNGSPLEPDELTDKEHAHAVALQDARLLAEAAERSYLGKLRVRIERGAIDRGVRWYFDLARGIVRRRENREVGS
jgi:hypothetical protein